ncbi:MAG: hypothetical protein JWR38_4876 [Mucilaginibacter sp.]|nr:hypothetical protein [Mucilaginibacter sp.]
MEEQQKGISNDNLRALKHDVRNQLSNIYLALEQLKYEIPDPSADCLFYIDTIAASSTRINTLLNSTD